MSEHAHLSIGEVLSLLQAEFPDVTISKIRFLESQGLLDPERTPSGYRKFYESDIDRLRWILQQQKDNFLPLKVIKDRLIERDQRQPAPPEEPHEASADGPDATGTPAVEPDPADPDGTGAAPVPGWLADLARDRAAKLDAPRPAAPVPGRDPSSSSPLDRGPTAVSMSFEELATASGLTPEVLRNLERFGLIEGRPVGNDTFYDGDALIVAQKAVGFLGHGIEARHLRMFKVAAEREAGFLEQVVMPMVKQRNPQARRQAIDTLAELSSLGESLRAALLRRALREYLEP